MILNIWITTAVHLVVSFVMQVVVQKCMKTTHGIVGFLCFSVVNTLLSHALAYSITPSMYKYINKPSVNQTTFTPEEAQPVNTNDFFTTNSDIFENFPLSIDNVDVEMQRVCNANIYCVNCLVSNVHEFTLLWAWWLWGHSCKMMWAIRPLTAGIVINRMFTFIIDNSCCIYTAQDDNCIYLHNQCIKFPISIVLEFQTNDMHKDTDCTISVLPEILTEVDKMLSYYGQLW